MYGHPDEWRRRFDARLGNLVRLVDSVAFDDSQPLQTAKATGLPGEHFDLVRMQMSGITAVPTPDDGPALVMFPGGQTERGFLLGHTDQRTRPLNNPQGSLRLYDPGSARANTLYYPDGKIKQWGPGYEVEMGPGPEIKIKSNVTIEGVLTVTEKVVSPTFDGCAKCAKGLGC